MTALTLWLLAVGLADLVAGTREAPVDKRRVLVVGALAAIAVGGAFALGLAGTQALVVAGGIASSGVAWLMLSGSWALGSLGLSVAVLLLVGGLVEPGGRGVSGWLDDRMLITDLSSEAVLLITAVALFLVGTGNTIVRVALGTIEGNPLRGERSAKGGRVIGPLERVLIFGLGLAGQLTAVGFVVAAKSLLRLGDVRGTSPDSTKDGVSAEIRSEYIVVGSLISWSVALAAIGLATIGIRLR